MKNKRADYAAMRPSGRHEGSYNAVRTPVPKPRDYAEALSVIFHEKISSPLKRAACRMLELVVGNPPVPGQTASSWLAAAVPKWSQRKLTKHFRRTARRLPRGYCAVPGRFQPVEGAERLKCFTVLAEEVKRRAREFNNTARKLREQAHAEKFGRPGQTKPFAVKLTEEQKRAVFKQFEPPGTRDKILKAVFTPLPKD